MTSPRGARNDPSKIENNKTQQPENTSNNNKIWVAVIAYMQDARNPIHRVRIPYFRFSSPKRCRNVQEDSLKIGHTRLTRFFSFSNAPTTPEGHWYACVRGCLEILWHHKHANEENTRSFFSCFLRWSFFESLYALWYSFLLHNIIFWQNFILGFLFLIKNMKLYDI